MIKTNFIEGNIAVLAFAMKPQNVLNEDSLREFEKSLDKLLVRENLRGIIIVSENKEFIFGADLNMLWNAIEQGDKKALLEKFNAFHDLLRKMETAGIPVVSIITGTCLGGGYELTLATHYRIAVQGNYDIGLPEVKLGLFPGGGGSQRLPRMLGIQKALEILTQGKIMRPKSALKAGLIDFLAKNKEEALAEALRFIKQNPAPQKLWDNKGKIPGGNVYSPTGMQIFTAANGLARANTRGNYPHIQYCLSAVYEGLQLPFDRAIRVEAKYLAKTLLSKETKHMLKTLWFGMNALKKGSNRPKNIPRKTFSKIGILGAGLMGSGIALVAAMNKINVVIKDISLEKAENALKYARKFLQKRIEKNKLTEAEFNTIISRIVPTSSYEDLADCELVIEAVFEDKELKGKVIRETAKVLKKGVIFASNTSTLPIFELAEFYEFPENFVGLHFFSPVEKMMLLEVIHGKKTSEKNLANALDFATQIRKIPIVVGDSRGFFTTRVFSKYLEEGVKMVEEGIPPSVIEQAGKQAGMPMGPLELADAVGLDIAYNIILQTEKDTGIILNTPMKRVLQQLVEAGRLGKKTKKGFYTYFQGGKELYKEFFAQYPRRTYDYSLLQKRLLIGQTLEAEKVLEEGIIRDTTSADVGSVLGWGFAPFTGGVLSYRDFLGEETFREIVERLHQ